jgi:hypothetical protein
MQKIFLFFTAFISTLIVQAETTASDPTVELGFGAYVASPTVLGIILLGPLIVYSGWVVINNDLKKGAILKSIINRKLVIFYIFTWLVMLLGYFLRGDLERLEGANEIMSTILGAILGFVFERITSETEKEVIDERVRKKITDEDIDGKILITMRTVEASSQRLKAFIEQASGRSNFEKQYPTIQTATEDIANARFHLNELLTSVNSITGTSSIKSTLSLFSFFPANTRLLHYLAVARKRAMDLQQTLSYVRKNKENNDKETTQKLEIFDGVLTVLLSDLTMANNNLTNSFGIIPNSKTPPNKDLFFIKGPNESNESNESNDNQSSKIAHLIDKQSESDFEALSSDINSLIYLIESQFSQEQIQAYNNTQITIFANAMSDHSNAFNRGINKLQELNLKQ